MKTILVTGGAGYIGSHTTVELLNSGYNVIIVDNYSNSQPEVIDRIEVITGKRPMVYKLNLTNKRALKKVFRDNSIDAVIHFAGYKAVGESVKHPLLYYNNNIVGTVVLCEVMNDYNVKQLVFSSSATVYGADNTSPLTEDLPLCATNPYGRIKIMIEDLLRDLSVSDPEWSIV